MAQFFCPAGIASLLAACLATAACSARRPSADLYLPCPDPLAAADLGGDRLYGILHSSQLLFVNEDTLAVVHWLEPGPRVRVSFLDLKSGRVTGPTEVPSPTRYPSAVVDAVERVQITGRDALAVCGTDGNCTESRPGATEILASPTGRNIAYMSLWFDGARLTGGGEPTACPLDETVKSTQGLAATLVPGESEFLQQARGGEWRFVRYSGCSLRQLPADRTFVSFLDDTRYITLDRYPTAGRRGMMRVETANGQRYEFRVTDRLQTWVVPAASGHRFLVGEHGYTLLNRLVHPLDLQKTRRNDWQSVRVFDTASGRELFRKEWEPLSRDSISKPAISPSGTRVAVFIGAGIAVWRVE